MRLRFWVSESAPVHRFRTLALMVLATWTSPLPSVLQVPTFRTTASNKFRPPQCRMPLRSVKQASPKLIPRQCAAAVLTSSLALSTRHQWFPCGPLLVRHLTWFLPGLFLPCSRPWLLTTAAGGDLEPAPVSRFRGACPHRYCSYVHWALRPFALVAHAHGRIF